LTLEPDCRFGFTMKVLKTEIYHPKERRPEKRAVNVDNEGRCSAGDLLEWVVFTLAHFERAFFKFIG